MQIHIKRAYDQPSPDDGYRILVDRLWPRGVAKQSLGLDLWLKDIAPSTELREWFSHDPKKFPEFKARYKKELKNNPAAEQLFIVKKPKITLIYAAKDPEHNQAVVLKEFLESKN